MIIVVVGKRRNTTPWFSAVDEKNARTATANRTDRNRKLHEPQTARIATANRMNSDRKPHEQRPQTARTATANRTNSDREPQRNRSVNLFLGSTVPCLRIGAIPVSFSILIDLHMPQLTI